MGLEEEYDGGWGQRKASTSVTQEKPEKAQRQQELGIAHVAALIMAITQALPSTI